jgi:nitroreductase
MDTLEAILTRRSVRQYQDRPVPPELVELLLKAAMQAPSARNQQPWHFLVLNDRERLAAIAGGLPNSAMAERAALAILVCGDESLEKSAGYWVVDCAAAAQNILLAAHASGLGAVWTGIYPRQPRMEFLRRLLHLPDNVLPHSLVVLGYPVEVPRPEYRYRPERVRYNGWGEEE